MKIRKTTIKDFEKIIELSSEYDKCENKLNKNIKIRSLDIVKKEERTWIKLGSKYIFAEENNEVLGMMAFSLGKIGKEKIGIIHVIIIKEGARGKGIGKSMVNYVFDYFKKNKCSRIKSFVHIKNKKSFNFWKKQGFEAEEGFAIQRKLQ